MIRGHDRVVKRAYAWKGDISSRVRLVISTELLVRTLVSNYTAAVDLRGLGLDLSCKDVLSVGELVLVESMMLDGCTPSMFKVINCGLEFKGLPMTHSHICPFVLSI